MTSREDIERTLRDAYAARQRGDLDALSRVFAPNARFQMAGSNTSRSPPGSRPRSTTGRCLRA